MESMGSEGARRKLHLEARLLDQAQARAPLFWGHWRSIVRQQSVLLVANFEILPLFLGGGGGGVLCAL